MFITNQTSNLCVNQVSMCTRKKRSSGSKEKFNYNIDDIILYKHRDEADTKPKYENTKTTRIIHNNLRKSGIVPSPYKTPLKVPFEKLYNQKY